MADLHGDRVSHLLVDARPVDHPTARNRGIGRYTIGLLSGLQQVGAPVVALYETDTEAGVLAAAVPGLALQRWSPAVIRAHTMPGAWYLATQLMLHPIPLDPVPRIITEAGLPVAAVMYDVIPERYPEQYQQRHTARAQVQLRGILTRTLDALLAISQFAADTAAHELRFPAQRIAMIGAGVEGQFMPATADPWPRLREVLHADGRAVVVSVVGSDPRKNTHRLLSAWGKVPAAVRRTHRLVVVGAHDDALLAQWQQWAHAAGVGHDVAFTGGVTDDEMVAVHQVAALAVMPSTEEGFGLPVLEAAACGCLVITSNVSSLPEVLAERAAEFDPYDVAAIAAAIERALTDAAHRDVLWAAAQRAVLRWTWAGTGSAVMSSLAALGPRQRRTLRQVAPRIALAGAFDDSPTGRANTLLAEAIAGQVAAPEVHLLVDGATTDRPTHAGPGRFPVRALGRFVHPSLFDHVVTLAVDARDARAALVDHGAAQRTLALAAVGAAVGAAVDATDEALRDADRDAVAVLEWLAHRSPAGS